MDIRKLWDNADDKSEYKSVCDVYGAEHFARLIGASGAADCAETLLTKYI